MKTNDILALIKVLDELAASTWHKIERGPERGLRFGEESITDHNLFELDRTSSAVEIYKFNHPQEAVSGADFDWYIGSDSQRWIGLRFQAKKLDDGAYAELGHRVGAARQYDVLLRQAARDGVWPFYCFYNGWSGPWPAGVTNATCPGDHTPGRGGAGTKACFHAHLEHFGCAIAPAYAVAARHMSPNRRGRLELDDYLAQSRPWSHLFRGFDSRDALPVKGLVRALEELLGQWADWADGSRDDVDSNAAASVDRPRLLGELPAWLNAARRGEAGAVGYRPRLAAVLDVSVA